MLLTTRKERKTDVKHKYGQTEWLKKSFNKKVDFWPDT